MEDIFKQARKEMDRQDRDCNRMFRLVFALGILLIVIVYLAFDEIEKEPKQVQSTVSSPAELRKLLHPNNPDYGRTK